MSFHAAGMQVLNTDGNVSCFQSGLLRGSEPRLLICWFACNVRSLVCLDGWVGWLVDGFVAMVGNDVWKGRPEG